MAFLWNPGVYRDSTFTALAKPVKSLRIIDQWNFRTSEVPRKTGGSTAGHSLAPARIEISGEMAMRGGSPHTTEKLMFQLYEDVRNKVHVTNETKFDFYLYYDPTDGTNYRKFVSCYPVNMNLDLGDDDRDPFPYSLTIQTDDPTIYKGSAG